MITLERQAEQIMAERFGKDAVISLATVENGVPYVRYVDAYYKDGAFYIITHALSNKMRQIEKNADVAIADGLTTDITILRTRIPLYCG